MRTTTPTESRSKSRWIKLAVATVLAFAGFWALHAWTHHEAAKSREVRNLQIWHSNWRISRETNAAEMLLWTSVRPITNPDVSIPGGLFQSHYASLWQEITLTVTTNGDIYSQTKKGGKPSLVSSWPGK